MRENLHSRVMAWLKVILPLVALALLSTLFLFSRSANTVTDLPFAVEMLGDNGARQQVSAPFFSTTTNTGDTISVTADRARPDPENSGVAFADAFRATIGTTDGGLITLRANIAELNEPRDSAVVTGDVEITSTTGYVINAQSLTSALSNVLVTSETQVTGSGPVGTFRAGKLRIENSAETGDIQMLFTDGVKLVYDPRE